MIERQHDPYKFSICLEIPNFIARLMLPFMRFSKTRLMELLDSAFNGALRLVGATKRLQQSKCLDFLIQYFKLEKKEWGTYRAYKQLPNQEDVAEVELISSILKQEGWQELERLLNGKNK